MKFLKGLFSFILFILIDTSIVTAPILIFLFFNYTTYWWYLFLEGMSKEQLEIIDKFGAVIFPGIAIAVPVAIVLIYRRSRKRRKEIIRKSDENNTFVTARLVKNPYIRGKGMRYRGIYEYTLNGEVKEYQVITKGHSPKELRLYPKKENSNRFFSDIGSDHPAWIVIPLGCLLTIIVLFWTIAMWNTVTEEIDYKDRRTKYYQEETAHFFIDCYNSKKILTNIEI